MSDTRPTLTTDRLILRPFELSDAADVQRLAGAREVAAPTLSIPHPYEDGMAESWIAVHAEKYDSRENLDLAITLAETGEFVGSIGLGGYNTEHKRADLGYWIGTPYWGRGICTEAARRMVRFGFEELERNRVTAHHLAWNKASGRVMQKIGMTHEGTMRQHVCKWDKFEDIESYGILHDEFDPE